jgi:transcriptional regulator with XRE-family HTH domain
MMTDTECYLLKLGETIRTLRANLGYSQESLADKVGIHRTYIGSIERGERNVSLENLLRISEALELSLSSLMAIAEQSRSIDGADG